MGVCVGGFYQPSLLPVQNLDMKRLSKQGDVLCRKKGNPDAREEERILPKMEIHSPNPETQDSQRRPAETILP